MTRRTVAQAIRATLLIAEPRAKVMAARALLREWRTGHLDLRFDVDMPESPGRPNRPELLPPGRMPKRGRGQSLKGRVALIHALAHIEFVAIDLALDMAGRFGSAMDPDFTDDFLAVAADEALHFALLDRHLRKLGFRYGDLPAHGGLWKAAHATRHDVAARLAVVPMLLEARGLDVTPRTIMQSRAAGDDRAARILERILDDEIRHVRFGAKHFAAVSLQRGECPDIFWKRLVEQHFGAVPEGPFNDSARVAAGLSRSLYGTLA